MSIWPRRILAETIGTFFLLVAVVGSARMAVTLGADAGLALLINAVVTGLTLAVLIVTLIGVSGAHFNPVVTAAAVRLGELPMRHAPRYVAAQLVGGFAGVVVANAMFSAPLLAISTTERWSGGVAIAEVVATAGLVFVIFALVRQGKLAAVGPAVGGYIAAAYFFTSSTSFANPAVTISRMFTDAPSGIDPTSVPAFLLMQGIGAVIAVLLVPLLVAHPDDAADRS